MTKTIGSLATVSLLAAVLCGGCGGARDLPKALDALSKSDRAMVRALSHAAPDEAAGLRTELAYAASPQMTAAIKKGEVVEGMTPTEVLRAWGEPDVAGRPWLITDGKYESWGYKAPGLPLLSVGIHEGVIKYASYQVTGSSPSVPRGTFGWLKQWPTREQLKDSHW